MSDSSHVSYRSFPGLALCGLPLAVAFGSTVLFHMPSQVHGSWLRPKLRPSTRRVEPVQNELANYPVSARLFGGPFSDICIVVGFSVRGAPVAT
jgi:hypothetical protein